MITQNRPASLNIIGCGRLGKTLTRLWHDNNLFCIRQILNQSQTSTTEAITFVGAGSVAQSYSALSTADVWLIAADDQAIPTIVQNLANTTVVKNGDLVFHCSGILGSEVLTPLKEKGALIASIHPIHGFANPATSINNFAGSFCAAEGDAGALAKLAPVFEQIGAQLITINSADKLLYHASSVIGCNYLIGLLDASQQCFELSGIDRQQSAELLRPIVHAIVDSVLDSSPSEALVGPIARGDVETVSKQLSALEEQAPDLATIYRLMGERNVKLADLASNVEKDKLAKLLAVLSR